ncbi:hypothetical protein HanRHA438_Chr11g0483291 [Helianthus annuus]|nr:hypothetical protein HanRHA438_Chr11g0483291 [Helianthus annuus]
MPEAWSLGQAFWCQSSPRRLCTSWPPRTPANFTGDNRTSIRG